MRETVSEETPTAFPAVRVLQRWRLGGDWPAISMIVRTVASGIERLVPRPGWSTKPASPSRTKCCDYLWTQGTLTPNWRAA